MKHARRAVTAALALAVSAALWGTAARAELVQTFIATPLAEPGGEFRAEIKARTYDTLGEKPPQLSRLVVRFPRSLSINRRAADVCTRRRFASTFGKRCPRGSKIGAGKSAVDIRPAAAEPLNGKLRAFNGPLPRARGGVASILLAIQSKLLSAPGADVTQFTPARGVIANDPDGPYGLKLDLQIDYAKGSEVLQPAFTELTFSLGKLGSPRSERKGNGFRRGGARARKVNWLEPPRRCRGGWQFEATFVYADGSTSSKSANLDCPRLP